MTSKTKILGDMLLKLETRSKTGSGRKMLYLNISYFIPGVFLPWLLLKQNADPTGFQFSFLLFLFYTLILSFTVITELDNIIISKTEAEILSALPIESRVLINAKMYMITRYLMLLSLPLLVPGSVYYYFMMKSLPRAFLFFISAFMICFFVINLLILLYSAALRIFKAKSIGSYTMFFQMAMILVLIMAYQFVSFGITGRPGSSVNGYITSLQSKGLINFFPQAWFAFLTTRNQYLLEFGLIAKLILPLFITILSYYSLKMYLDANYEFIRDKFVNSKIISRGEKGKKRFFIFTMISDLIQNVYLRNNTERSSFGLIRSLFYKDKTVRLAILPMIIIPIGLAVFALVTNQLPAPFDRSYFEIKPVFHISLMLCVLVVLNTAIIGTKVTNFPGVAWIYDSYPITSRRNFKNGFRKFFVVYLLIPVSIGLGIIFMIKIPMHQALLHIVFIFTSANLYNSIYNLFSRGLPFTKENTLINSFQRMTSIIYPFLFGIVIVMVQLFVYRSMLTTLIALLAIISVTFWINYFGFVRKK
ncbi:MAG: hypothetical protein ABI543_00885 [Ignavibacteria bacterium]